jgi:hypothetical protein
MSSLCCGSVSSFVISQIHIVPQVGNLSAQFGPRWHESNSNHNEDNLQDEQQTVDYHFFVSAID